MPVSDQLITPLLADYKSPEDLLGERSYQLLHCAVLPEAIRNDWLTIKTLSISDGYRIVKDKKSALDRCYLISSAELDVGRFAAACRGHQSIENKLYWLVDVSFDGDSCTIYSEKAAVNLAAIRHIALNMMRQKKAES